MAAKLLRAQVSYGMGDKNGGGFHGGFITAETGGVVLARCDGWALDGKTGSLVVNFTTNERLSYS